MAMEFALIGGDLRNVKLMNVLTEAGCKVYTYGLLPEKVSEKIAVCVSPETAAAWAQCVIGPVPFHVGIVDSDQVLQALSPGKLFIAGKIPEDFTKAAEQKGVKVVDILQRDDMAILNAVPTAEGAIQVAMEKLPVTIDQCPVLITGYGRVARALAPRVKALGGLVTICARKSSDLAWAESHGYGSMSFAELSEKVGDFTLIYNTVPHMIFDTLQLDALKKNRTGDRPQALVVDLASAPGGVNFTYAASKGIQTVHALSLPGKVAPETSAKNMAKVIFNIIKELTGEAAENVN